MGFFSTLRNASLSLRGSPKMDPQHEREICLNMRVSRKIALERFVSKWNLRNWNKHHVHKHWWHENFCHEIDIFIINLNWHFPWRRTKTVKKHTVTTKSQLRDHLTDFVSKLLDLLLDNVKWLLQSWWRLFILCC